MKKRLVGKIISTKMAQSAVVEVDAWKTHRLFDKRYRTTKKYLVHNPDDQFKTGETIEMTESRPISRRKHWIITKKLAEAPITQEIK